MPIYTNVDGGRSKLTSIYNKVDGASKTHSKIYANINSSNKLVYQKEYTWAKHTWKYSGSKSYVMGSCTSNQTTSYDNALWRDTYLFTNCTPISNTTYRLSNAIKFGISTSYPGTHSSTIKYIIINDTKYSTYENNSNDGNWHTISNGISYKYSGGDQYLSFPTFYSTEIGDMTDYATTDPYDFTLEYYSSVYAIKEIYWEGSSDKHRVIYDQYSKPSYTCLWVPDTVQYVTSTNRNAYTENNTNVNVNNSYNYPSETTFPWNPTYRFIG